MWVSVGLEAATAATSASGLQQAQIGPEAMMFLFAIAGIGWAVHQIKSAASGSLADREDYDACERCGSIVPDGEDRCESCAAVGSWRK